MTIRSASSSSTVASSYSPAHALQVDTITHMRVSIHYYYPFRGGISRGLRPACGPQLLFKCVELAEGGGRHLEIRPVILSARKDLFFRGTRSSPSLRMKGLIAHTSTHGRSSTQFSS